MKIYTYKSIEGCSQDILGRNKLAECIAIAILSYSKCYTDNDERFVFVDLHKQSDDSERFSFTYKTFQHACQNMNKVTK